MSDRELRRLEKALAVQPDAADLHRQRADQLWRVGRSDAALASLDLAWRLGASVWAQLEEQLAQRRVVLEGVTLCYVPAGPFVMGRDDHDDDAPPHLVELSGFYMAQQPLRWRTLFGWEHVPHWIEADNDWFLDRMYLGTFKRANQALQYLAAQGGPPDLVGRYRLPSEAQWERVFRSCHLRPNGSCPYGVGGEGVEPEWTRDFYNASYYERSPRQDPQGPTGGDLRVVRGIRAVPPRYFASFREAAREDGTFPVRRRLTGTTWLSTDPSMGLHVRPVFELA